jgi:hypothetical protein
MKLTASLVASMLLVGAASQVQALEDAGAPKTLTIGYEGEGKVDASPATCMAIAQEVEGSRGGIKEAAEEICQSRQHHIDAYNAMQDSYRKLITAATDDGGLHPVQAAEGLKAMMNACIDHKFGLVNHGHRSMLLILPDEIAASCLELGRKIVDTETAAIAGDADRMVP